MNAAKSVHRILMCRPDFFNVSYEINPWMSKTIQVDQLKALKQWEKLKYTLENDCQARIDLVDPVEGEYLDAYMFTTLFLGQNYIDCNVS